MEVKTCQIENMKCRLVGYYVNKKNCQRQVTIGYNTCEGIIQQINTVKYQIDMQMNMLSFLQSYWDWFPAEIQENVIAVSPHAIDVE